MKRSTLEILACPVCGGDVSLKTRAGGKVEIDEGTLKCVKCGRTYMVREGIPRMLPARQ